METQTSATLFERAQRVIPGGVNSPVRAFGSVGGDPRFMACAQGASIYDEDGNEYTDYIGSWGPMLLGHNQKDVQQAVLKSVKNGLSYGTATKLEVEMAELVCEIVPSAEMVRMVNSGTEAVMSAVRMARGYTGKSKIIKFDGCYHGHSDAMLVKAGSGALTTGVPSSAGVPEGCTQDTLTATYNDLASVKEWFEKYPEDIAGIILEPVAANMGVIAPEDGFLQGLRDLCDNHQSLLIFDEVITGFRLALGGAQEYYSIAPDISVFGKIIGGGLPVGAYAASKEVMEVISPVGPVYQAGTLSGNPIAMAAGLAQLKILQQNNGIYKQLEEMGERLRRGLIKQIETYELPLSVSGVGSLSCLYFSKELPKNYKQAQQADTDIYANFFAYMLDKGIYLAPAQFEAIFLSAAHTSKHIDYFLECTEDYFGRMK